MSAEQFRPSADAPHLKGRTQIKKDAKRMYKQSFDDLDHMTIYRDPMGMKTPGFRGQNTVELQKQRRDQLMNDPVAELEGKSVAEFWNERQRNGWSVQETTKEIRKNLDTGDWTLPRDIISEVFVINPERLPMADMMTRVTTQDDEVVATARAEEPSIEWGLETTDDTEGSYTYSDPTYDDDPTYPVVGLGAATRLEDKLILSSSNLRNAESTQEQAFIRAMEQEIEAQIILGTDNNSNGWDGLENFVDDSAYRGDIGDTSIDDTSSANPEDYETATRTIIDEAEFQGAPKENLAVVCGFDWHKNIRDSLVSQQRYEGNIEELNAGFSTLTLDNVPVFKSHAIPRISDRSAGDYNQAYTVNMDATYLAMLQETSIKPLAKVAPQEQMAVDAYGTLVSEDFGAHVQAGEVTVP